MASAFSFKTYYNPYISPMTNSVWGVVSVTANELPPTAQSTVISLICDVSGSMQGAKFNAAIATRRGFAAQRARAASCCKSWSSTTMPAKSSR